MASLRGAARVMVESGVAAVLVESPIGPVGLITASDLVEAIATGADPDVLWAGEISRPAPKVVSCEQHPVELGEEMVADGFDMVAVMDEGIPLGLASALDVLGAVLRGARETPDHAVNDDLDLNPACTIGRVATLEARAVSPHP